MHMEKDKATHTNQIHSMGSYPIRVIDRCVFMKMTLNSLEREYKDCNTYSVIHSLD